MPRPEERFPATDRKILRRLDEAAIRQVSLGIVATLLSFVAIVWIGELWLHWPKIMVLVGGAVLAVSLLQAVLILAFEAMYPRGPLRWRRRFAFTLLLRAAVWSTFLVLLLEVQGGGGLFLLAMFLPLTLGAALAATWLADIWTVRLYLAISLLPPIIRLLLEMTPEATLVAAFLATFLYAMGRMAEHHYRLFWRLLSREGSVEPAVPVAGSVHARLLLRSANELRGPVSTAADALTLLEQGSKDPQLLASARRATRQLVDRLEAMEAGAGFLRGSRVPELLAGSLRRRLEEAADDIGIAAADAGVLCTTHHDTALPERLRTDFEVLFRGLRALSGWVLEQLPPGGELVLRCSLVPGQHDDYLRCAVDVGAIHLPEALRNAVERAARGEAVLDPDLPLPLAVAGESARLLGGRLVDLAATEEAPPALALDIRLDAAERPADDAELRARLQGHALLLVGGTPTLQQALAAEAAALDLVFAGCPPELLAARLGGREQERLLVLLDGRDPAALRELLRSLREQKVLRGARLLVLAPGTEPPALDDLQRLVHGWLRLPLGQRRLRQKLARLAGAEAEAAVVAPLRVLVADDNPVNLQVMRGMLEKTGCDVESVADGAAAVARVARGGIDLVLMDAEMPVLDGAEATRRIREAEAARNAPRLPIVAVTAHTGEAELAALLAAGVDDCVAKPVSLASLAARIDRIRQRR